MAILKLAPWLREQLWGGNMLRALYGAGAGEEPAGRLPIGEAWTLSCHPEGPCTVENGPFAGETLAGYMSHAGVEVLGANCAFDEEFPLLIKLIDAREALSVQVHPGDDYALQHEGEQGKCEAWVVVHSEPGAHLYIGFERAVTPAEVCAAIEAGTLTGLLRRVPAEAGRAFLIEPGTVHAIGAGVLLAEVEQNSNLTYRLYDYGRRAKGPDGEPRPLHIEKALEVANLTPARLKTPHRGRITAGEHFVVDRLEVQRRAVFHTGEDSFAALLVLEGNGLVRTGDEELPFGMGDCFFVEAGTGAWALQGECAALYAAIPPGHRRLWELRRAAGVKR